MPNIENHSVALISDQSPNTQIETQKIISLNKFIFLSILTMGLYQIWWMFKVWRFFMQKDKLNVMPAFRAVFALFFLYSLVKRIQSAANAEGYTERFSALGSYLGFIVFSLLFKLPAPYELISLLNVLFLIPAFKAFNFARQQSNQCVTVEQKKFSRAQKIVIVIFSILWFFYLLGLFILAL
ncbi:MAG: hypothetical protein GAK29_00549 [Acinetobacter bereziniae]|uniref:DUF4234 domain-containing protein n=1 Tax=Acinetobacter bereziniae TaxID=106648 RepID=A0A833PHB5_ACIBZ|nr:MAG: hypothetical protein GAK29_00549 [Acinetobacter bereziniae]